MIQKSTIITPADKCGVLSTNTFHLYRGFFRKVSHFGEFIKVSIRQVKPENPLVKKSKRKALVIRTKKEYAIVDGATIRFDYNSAVLLKKRLTPEGKEIFGPVIRSFKKKKFISSFSGIM